MLVEENRGKRWQLQLQRALKICPKSCTKYLTLLNLPLQAPKIHSAKVPVLGDAFDILVESLHIPKALDRPDKGHRQFNW